jgi:WD40 repeat protein
MSPVNVEERLRSLREQALRREAQPDAWPRLQRRLRRRARSVRTVAAAAVLVLVLAGFALRLLDNRDRVVVRPPQPVPAAPKLIARLTANGPGGHTLAFSTEGKTLAVAGNHRITLWDVGRQTAIARLDAADAVAAVAFAPDGRTLASSAYDRVVLWDLASRARRATLPMGTFNIADRLAFSPDGKILAGGDGGGKLILWDVARRSRLAILSTGIGSINDLAFRADGRSVVVGGNGPGYSGRGDGVAIIDVARRRRLPALRMPAGSGSYTAVAFRPDGTALAAVGSLQHDITVWDVTRRTRLATLTTPSQVLGVVLSRDGGRLAATNPRGEVTLWDVGRHAPLGPLPGFHPRREFFLSPRTGTLTDDGGRLAISDGTGSIFVWSTSNP